MMSDVCFGVMNLKTNLDVSVEFPDAICYEIENQVFDEIENQAIHEFEYQVWDAIENQVCHEIEDAEWDEFVKEHGKKDDDDHTPISEIAPDDPRLFPNKNQDYYESIKFLFNHENDGIKPPLCLLGNSNAYSEEAEYKSNGEIGQRIQLGQELDVVSLSSSSWRLLRVGGGDGDGDGDYIRPITLKDKYVVIVCVFAPLRWVECDTKVMCQLQILSHELSKARNFEMVIVPKMKKYCEGDKAAFDKLLSAFPKRLFVPFEDEDLRDEICQRLAFRGPIEVFLVDSTHNKVEQDDVFDIVANRCYPSSSQRNIKTQIEYCLSPDWIIPPTPLGEMRKRCRDFTLVELLDSAYCDPTLCLESIASSETSTTVGQLSNNLVGIYLFQFGDKLDSFVNVYNQCREKGLDFEIVVVCISLDTSIDPLVFNECAMDEIKRRIPRDTPWWVLPYNAGTYSTLRNLVMELLEDTMITVGPARKPFVDANGGQVAHFFGIQAYPFNREMVVHKYKIGAKAITLDSLLSHGPIDYVVRGGEQVRVADLYDKVVVVYTGFELDYDSYTYKWLSKWHKEIRKQHTDFEVVFVYYGEGEGSNNEKQSSDGMELLVRPFEVEHSNFVRNHESFLMGENGYGYPVEGLRPEATLLFGKGGHLCAIHALLRFEEYGLDGYPYETGFGDDYIRAEIISSVSIDFRDVLNGYGNQKPYDVVTL